MKSRGLLSISAIPPKKIKCQFQKKKKGEKGKKEKEKKKKEIGNPKRRHETNGIGLSIMRMLLFLSHPENKNCVCGKRHGSWAQPRSGPLSEV